MDLIFIKPVVGAIVRNPATKLPLPAEGARVRMSTYWNRRLKDGSVVEAKPGKNVEKKTDEAKKPQGKGGE
jgi:hypothetical protein